MQKERILNIGCIAFFGSCLFWLWLTWYSVQAEQVRQCGEDLQACRAAYCAACLTDTECERICKGAEYDR